MTVDDTGAAGRTTTTFGIGKDDMVRSGLFGAIIGGIVFVVGLAGSWMSGRVPLRNGLGFLAGVCLAIALVLPLMLAASGVLRVRLMDGRLAQLVGPWVVVERPLLELERIVLTGRLFPMVFEFRDGTRARLLGIHLRKREDAIAAVRREVPGIVIVGRSFKRG